MIEEPAYTNEEEEVENTDEPDFSISEETNAAALRGHETVMVTTRDIDAQIRELSRIIGYGIDLALQPLDFFELCALMG